MLIISVYIYIYIVQVGSTKDLHIKVTDMKKGTSYDVRITARNHVGYGKPYQPDDPVVGGKRISEYMRERTRKKNRYGHSIS